jgi:cyclophilin family peptidyl-prolyl cis-trans isomerase
LTRFRLTLVAPLALALAACGASQQQTTAAAPAPAATTTTTSTTPGGCRSVTPPPAEQRHGTKPTTSLDPSKTYDVTLRTNCGSFVIRLAVKTSPHTTASFVALARAGYFDRTVFHRIVPGFIIQGGDPTGSGTGDPGYKTVDPPPPNTRYTFGTVAMAKTQTEAPGTSGSQFFVVTGADAGLPAEYAVLGTVVAGIPVVRRIGKLGDPTTEQPTETVELERATVRVK